MKSGNGRGFNTRNSNDIELIEMRNKFFTKMILYICNKIITSYFKEGVAAQSLITPSMSVLATAVPELLNLQ